MECKRVKKNRKKGFSMVELIIVIAIMAILVGVVGTVLIPYLEKTRANKDLVTLDTIYDAYSSTIAESDEPSKISLSDKEVLELVGVESKEAMDDFFKSKQLKGTSVQCFYNTKTGMYGVCAKGQGGYTGVQIDNMGANPMVGVTGDEDYYFDKTKDKLLPLQNNTGTP